jgi:hypothetical protein
VKCEKNGNEQQLGDTQARPLPDRRSFVRSSERRRLPPRCERFPPRPVVVSPVYPSPARPSLRSHPIHRREVALTDERTTPAFDRIESRLRQTYALDKLLKGKQTYKGLVVPGGKADMMFTALDFGNDEAEDEDDAFMDFL